MSLLDAMDMGLSGMTTGAALVGNGGISLGNMFTQNLQATRANLLHRQGGGNHAGRNFESVMHGDSADMEGAIGKALCEADPADALVKTMTGKEMYGANALVVKAASQMTGTLLDAVNEG